MHSDFTLSVLTQRRFNEVLMPCRALDAFGPMIANPLRQMERSLNALSGIGCIRTDPVAANALGLWKCLNALSGIGCIRTHRNHLGANNAHRQVLMPCRALDAFGPCKTLWEFHLL